MGSMRVVEKLDWKGLNEPVYLKQHRLAADRVCWSSELRFLAATEIFLFKLAPWPAQPPIQRVLGDVTPLLGYSSQPVQLLCVFSHTLLCGVTHCSSLRLHGVLRS
jgi:hypothetical protein